MQSSTDRTPARHRAQLTASDLSLRRGTTPVLAHVDLVVGPTSRIAVVGENGRGKSTLLHVLAGHLTPDTGTVRQIGTLGLAEQEMDASDDRTVRQAVAEAIAASLAALSALDAAATALAETEGDALQSPTAQESGVEGSAAQQAAAQYSAALEQVEALDAWDAERRVHVALAALDAPTDMDRRLADLSVGQRYRVRLACLLGAEDDFLLLDEPTNHLDRSALDFLTTQMRARRGGVVLVSHDRALLDDVAETVIDLDPTHDERPRVYGGGYAGYREGRLGERSRWEQAYARQQSEHARLRENLSAAQNRLTSGWRPEKGSPKHGRATRAGALVQSVHRRQEALEAHPITVPEPPQHFRFPDLTPRTGTLLDVHEVSVRGRLPHPVSFELSPGGRLVVTGPNGAGKSTLLAVASGSLSPDTGSRRTTPGTRLGFLPQETSLPPDRRVSELYSAHVDSLVAAGALSSHEALGLSHLGLLKSRETGKRISELSIGQQRRLDLALLLAARPHVLLLDEPTNHLSIALVDELTEALGATRAAVVVSTHDRQLLRDVETWPRVALAPSVPAPGVSETADSGADAGAR